MKRWISHLYFAGLIVWLLSGCNTTESRGLADTGQDTIQRKRIVPYYENGIPKGERRQLFLTNLSRIVGLPDISTGKDGLYIRIWFWEGEKRYVVNISKESTGSTCSILEWNSLKKDSADYIVVHKEWKHGLSISAWRDVWLAIDKFRIADLPGGRPYEKQAHYLTTMAYVQFEIARPGHYRFYEYLEPSFYRFIDEGSGKVHEFLKYLNKELDLPVYVYYEELFVKPYSL